MRPKRAITIWTGDRAPCPRRAAIAAAVPAIWAIVHGVPAWAESAHESAGLSTRIVHRFDFDERPRGNLEDVPKYWDRMRPIGFPHFANGSFDFDAGRTSPPSFHLASEGRNVVFQYTGPETRVRANTDYRIVGYVRADQIHYARACLSAHYIDQSGRPIVSSLVRSRYVGGAEDHEDWNRVELYLPTAPAEAETVGLAVWVLQEPLWSTRLLPKRHIQRNDVRGGAWFDDITLFALPRVYLATSSESNVLSSEDPQELYAVLADNDDLSLRGLLSITDKNGSVVELHRIDVVTDVQAEPVRISVAHLSPGLYRATLEVFAEQAVIRSRTLAFAKLPPNMRDEQNISRSFGVVVDPDSRSDSTVELSLLERLAVYSAKLPVWSGLADEDVAAAQRRNTDRLVQDLVKRGFALTGVFSTPPAPIVRSDGAYARPLLELLSGDRTVWNEHLAAAVAPHASAFRWWEIGTSVGASRSVAGQLALAVTQLRQAMRPFITVPRLAVPVSTTVEFTTEKLPVEQITLRLGTTVQADTVASYIEHAQGMGYEHVSALVEPLSAEEFRRLPRLADYARRVIQARHAGADTVFVPQPWHVRDTERGRITEPTEEFLVIRTIADALGDSVPGPSLRVAESVECLAFHEDRSSILVMWDPKAPPEGRTYTIQLGQADRQIDLWGRSSVLTRDRTGRHEVRLGRLPIFILDVDRWLIDFRNSLSVRPASVSSGTETVHHAIVMDYQGNRRLSGRIEPQVPESWNIWPRSFDFTLTPQRAQSYEVEIQYPHSEPAGRHNILAKVTLVGDGEPIYLEIPLRIDIGVADLDVSGMAIVERGELVLRQVVTNRSPDVLSFRASANVPGYPRQYRPISNLRPGDTHSVHYRFRKAEGLVGRTARITLREVNDGPRIHNLDLVIP